MWYGAVERVVINAVVLIKQPIRVWVFIASVFSAEQIW